jgi:hypothetical protein
LRVPEVQNSSTQDGIIALSDGRQRNRQEYEKEG